MIQLQRLIYLIHLVLWCVRIDMIHAGPVRVTSTAAASSSVSVVVRMLRVPVTATTSSTVGSKWYPTSRRCGSRRSSVARSASLSTHPLTGLLAALGTRWQQSPTLNGGCSWYTGISVMWVYVSLLSHPAEHEYSGRPSCMTSDVLSA
jgi:hypothetical protein